MGEIGGAILAITVMMTAVFVPVMFMSGPVGVFYRQFAMTMTTAIVLSGVVALTLTPVLCAMLLRDTHGQPQRQTPIALVLTAFERVFAGISGRYVSVLKRLVTRRLLTLAVTGGFALGIVLVNTRLPFGVYTQ
jgi:hydrophobic/amphiphilic exporter-1 (mainly G- bacteria), HAE1 family